MSFPISPIDGEEYTTNLGTKYVYRSATETWNIVTTGTAGAQGDTGIQGQTGLSLQGDTGIQGDTGLQGETGIGYVGSDGATGPQGNTGVQGETGLSLQGDTGIQGYTGIQGDTGIQGNTGIQGDTGIQGSTGIQGDTGITGLQGQTGLQGTTGLANFVESSTFPAISVEPVFLWNSTNEALYAGITGIGGNYVQISAGSLNGATGSQGTTGLGIQGSTGIQGTTGAQSGSWQDYSNTSTIVGFTGALTKDITYCDVGSIRYVVVKLIGTSNSATTSFTVPSNNVGTDVVTPGMATNNSYTETPCYFVFPDSVNVVGVILGEATQWPEVGTKLVSGQLFYRIS